MASASIIFFSEILSDCTQVPNVLLSGYADLGLSADDLLFLLRVIKSNNSWGEFQPDDLSGEFTDRAELNKKLKSLVKKGFINKSEREGYYSLEGLALATFELWTDSKRRRGQECYVSQKMQEDREAPARAAQFKEVYRAFEKEFGRGLSAIESEKLEQWLFVEEFSAELVREALARAVLQRKATFNYVNGILNRWQAAGYKTLSEVEAGDKRPVRAEGKKEKPSNLMKGNRFGDIMSEVNKG